MIEITLISNGWLVSIDPLYSGNRYYFEDLCDALDFIEMHLSKEASLVGYE